MKIRSLLWVLIVGAVCTNAAEAQPGFKLPSKGENNTWFRPTDSPTVVIFVHGFLSDSRSCWMSDPIARDKPGVYWPQLVAQDPTFGDVSIFLGGYVTELDSGAYGLTQAANDLYAALSRKTADSPMPPLDKDNIIFVCHSMGGVVVRELLVQYQTKLMRKHIGLVLIASPSYGSKAADRLAWLAELFQSEYGKTLRYASRDLKLLDEQFAEVLASHAIPRLDGTEAAENFFVIPSKLRVLRPKTYVVSPESANRYFNSHRILPGTNHFSCVKPTSVKAPAHRLLQDFYTAHFVGVQPADNKATPAYATAVVFSDRSISALGVSRDAHFLAYSRCSEMWDCALVVRQFHINSNEITIAHEKRQRIRHITFAPDNRFIYYVASNAAKPKKASAYRVPILGGKPELMVSDDVDTRPTFRRDGKQFAFIHGDEEKALSKLMVCDVDSKAVSEAALRGLPMYFSDAIWLPDDTKIVCVAGNNRLARSQRLVLVDVPTRTSRPIGDRAWWIISGLAAQPDGRGVTFAADDSGGQALRLWCAYLDGGRVEQAVQDEADFRQLDVTDANEIFTLIMRRRVNITAIDVSTGAQTPIPNTIDDGIFGLATLDRDTVVFQCWERGVRGICSSRLSGADRKRLTDAHVTAVQPAGCGGRIAYTSFEGGTAGIALMNRDGSQHRKVTNDADYFPNCAPNGSWLAYVSFANGQSAIRGISTVGTSTVALPMKNGFQPVISPDGTEIACVLPDEKDDSLWHIGIYSVHGSAYLTGWRIDNTSDAPPRLRWTPDGRALSYVGENADGSNVWLLRKGSDKPQKATMLSGTHIYSFDWTPDGTKLVCSLGHDSADVVYLTPK